MSDHDRLAARMLDESMRMMKAEIFNQSGKIITSDIFDEVVEVYDMLITH